MMAHCMDAIAFVFSEKNEMDSSMFYYEMAYRLAEEKNDSTRMKHILGQLAALYVKKKDYESTMQCLKPALQFSDVNSKNAYYTILSNIYMNTGKYDSAFIYCKDLYERGSIHAKLNVCRRLTDIYMIIGDIYNAGNYIH